MASGSRVDQTPPFLGWTKTRYKAKFWRACDQLELINRNARSSFATCLAILCRFTPSLLSWRKNWTCPSRYQNIRVSSSANHFVCWLFVLFCNYFVSFPISSHDYLVEAKPPNWTWLASVRREVTDQTHDQPVIVLLPQTVGFFNPIVLSRPLCVTC